jgi:hypothetical protein
MNTEQLGITIWHPRTSPAPSRPRLPIPHFASPEPAPDRGPSAPNKPNLQARKIALKLFSIVVYVRNHVGSGQRKQTQSKPILCPQSRSTEKSPKKPGRKPGTGRRHAGPVPSNAEGFRAIARVVPVPAFRAVQNKPNFPWFWPENAGIVEKRSQSNPIPAAPGRRTQEPT